LAAEAAGTFAILAEKLGISPQAVSMWAEVPIKRCPQVEAITGVPCAVLRPDFFRSASKRRRKK